MSDYCQEISSKILHYIDGDLPDSEKQVIEGHIKECKICCEELDSLKNLTPHLKTLAMDKNCPSIDLLIRFSENDVTFNEGKTVKAHLENCSYCRDEMTLLFELNQHLSLELSAEICSEEIMPASLRSFMEETYKLPVKVYKVNRIYGILDFVTTFFNKKQWISSMATCSIALFLALNGVFQLAPGYFSNNYSHKSFSQSPAIVSESNVASPGVELIKRDVPQKLQTQKLADESYVAVEVSGESVKDRGMKEDSTPGVTNSNINNESQVRKELEDKISFMEGIANASLSSNQSNNVMVKLTINPDYSITSTQVSSIITLVSDNMNVSYNDIVVYDSRGLVLSDNVLSTQKSDYANLMEQQRLEQHNFEEVLTRNAQNVLDKELGPGKSVVQVSSTIDFLVNEPLRVANRNVLSETEIAPQVFSFQEDKAGNMGVNSKTLPSVPYAYKQKNPEKKAQDLSYENSKRDFQVMVYPPGNVKKLNVYVALNNVDEDTSRVKDIVSSTVGLDQRRDTINVDNKTFKSEDLVVQEKLPVSVSTPAASVSVPDKGIYSKSLGVISLILASIFLIIGVRSILSKE
ncbi:MAG TPA: flagellar M-ring protein FliF C-terminal domain-containing protein [Candidatus Eremiobacteraeota bacterium]|nr:MAG: flagellar MS-ring protein [bacterium ADurb.Bin363]HPZ09160.1 flagellar M-ring protein FliF C-terminal domain-containing protein [Candidatus Eremiobacteraeota bacterium]